jgi:hypothetical protein
MYDTVAPGQPFTISNYPGAQPLIPAGTTAANLSQIIRQHTEDLREWREYTNINNALKKQLTEAIEPVYLRSQRDRHVGFANKTVRELFAYLFQAYGMLTPQTLIDNQTNMQSPWDPNTPFETLIEQIEDSMEMADAAAQAYTDAQVLTLSYTLVYNTGLYFDECKTWNTKAAADKTWDEFKTFFLHAQSELRLQQQATSARTGFSNYVNEQENQENATHEALTNLAAAQAADRQAFCQIVTNNSELADQLRTALKDITSLKDLVNNRPPPRQRKQHNSYCWTHGFRVSAEHNSANCKNPGNGHQTTATKDSIMGGSTAGKAK